MLASGQIRLCRGGCCIDLYNQHTDLAVVQTITTRINNCNHYWVATIKRVTKDMQENIKQNKAVIYSSANGNDYLIAIRKYTPTDCFRLMGVRQADIDKLMTVDKDGKRLISNSKLYQLAGNSIVTNCMVAMFDNLFYPKGEHQADKNGQLLLFT